jgi:hypothetical protein
MSRIEARCEMEIVAAFKGEFVLYERIGRASEEWRSLKLVRTTGQKGKRNWWFCWNGERLSRTSDAGRLYEQSPDVYAWVVSALRARCSPAGEGAPRGG